MSYLIKLAIIRRRAMQKASILGLWLSIVAFVVLGLNESVAFGAQSTKLIFADMASPNSVTAKCTQWWGSEIEKRTNGKVKFEYHWGGSLVGAYEQMNSVKHNVIQVTPYYSGYHPDAAPIPLIALLPMMNRGSLESGLKSAHQFFTQNREVMEEFKKNKVKYMNPLFSAHGYMWSKSAISNISDFKGLTIRAFGPFLTFFQSLGSSLVSVPVPEIYNSLERGVVKATLLYLTLAVASNIPEVAQYVNVTNLGHNCGMPMVMNLDTWNKLPEDVKSVIEQVNMNEAIPKFVDFDKENYDREMKVAESKKMNIVQFSEQDIQEMTKVAEERIWRPYAKQLEEKGLPGQQILKEYMTFVDKY
jgi:TRAP-type C4-dicarboxylate transport system substrate-binding protein